MHKEFEIEEYTAIEEQIHYYSTSLLVSHPEQIVKYLENGWKSMQKRYNMHIYIRNGYITNTANSYRIFFRCC